MSTQEIRRGGDRGADIGFVDMFPHYSELFSKEWEEMYGAVVSGASSEMRPGRYADALRRINYTIGIRIAAEEGQTPEQLHDDLLRRVKGSPIARCEALNGIQDARDLGICKVRISDNDMIQLRIEFSAPQNRI